VYLCQSEDEIIDCVDIYKQPSLNHPLLKNHTLQYATAFLAGDNFHGVNAIINIWNPIVEPNEYSSSQIWVTDGEGDKFESIEAGWMHFQVTPLNPYPSFFLYWTNDGYHTSGCYNLECAGFVQTTARLSLGARIIGPVSTYGGDQRIITVKIKQDLKTGYWWLYYQGLEVGHWPGDRLFKHLPVAAALLEWGGEIINKEANGTHTGTQMGSGVFPSEGFRKAAYFRSLEYVDGGGQVNPAEGITGYATRSECYDVAVGKTGEGLGGVHFYYGGPGFSNNCYN
ncbi:hypothetical protein LINPERPRIM_LOCUS19255, partial [Linum perenne]